jgi:hypothetical protein
MVTLPAGEHNDHSTIRDVRRAIDGKSGQQLSARREADAWADLKDIARREFAELNGWRICQSRFSLTALRDHKMRDGGDLSSDLWWSRFLDHAEFYRDRDKPYRVAAIVAQDCNNGAKQAQAFAAEHGLIVHLPPDEKTSWYMPGFTRLFCYTRPGPTVTWLPEQMANLPRAP